MRKIIRLLVAVLLFVNFLYVLSGVINFPVISIDVISIWMLKAKAFYLQNGFPLAFLRTINYSHPQYPILLPFIFFIVFKLFGSYNELYVLFIYPFIYLSILFVCYKTLLVFKPNKSFALITTYIYSMFSPLLAEAGRVHAGRADIVVLFINWIILYLSYIFLIKNGKKYLIYILLLIFINSQIKLEGILISFVFLFLPIDIKKKALLFTAAWVPMLVWVFVRIKLGISGDFGFYLPDITLIFHRLVVVTIQVVKEMLNYRNWYIFWPLFWLSTFIFKRKDRFIPRTLIPTLLAMCLAFVSVYLFSNIDTKAYVSSSVDRVMLQLSPFLIMIFIDRIYLNSIKLLKL